MKRILILSLKEQSSYVTRVQSMVSSFNAKISLVNEEHPKSLSSRMDLVANCDVMIVLSTLKLQRNMGMMELALAAYEKYKVMVVYPVEKNYRAFGILGKIAETNDSCSEVHLDNVTPDDLKLAVNAPVKSVIRVDLGTLEATTVPPKPTGDKIIVHSASDGEDTVRKLESEFKKAGIPFDKAPAMKSNEMKSCCVYIPVVSPFFLSSTQSEKDMEKARGQECHMRPITSGYNSSSAPNWAKLALCGKKIYKEDEMAKLTEEVRKLAKIANQRDFLSIQEDLNEAMSFLS